MGNKETRSLFLDGDDGTVVCTVHDKRTWGTLPRLTENHTVECATRSLLRMKNVTAVRGSHGHSMVGPLDYYGNLETPHRYLYTITIDDTMIPKWIEHLNVKESFAVVEQFDPQLTAPIKVRWIGGNSEIIDAKNNEYSVTSKNLRQSLFLHPGLLEIDEQVITLPLFDAQQYDLNSFKARLVRNDIPFCITRKELPVAQEYRLISYHYEPGYANWQVEKGSGLFLEKHEFSQTITPLSPDCGGFVTLARYGAGEVLELIAVHIPYGCTLIVEKDCIHGDTNLVGKFAMGMTSDHVAMGTADTVFLKHSASKTNVCIEIANSSVKEYPVTVLPVIYNATAGADRIRVKKLTRGASLICNPTSREYLKCLWGYRR